MKKRPAFFESIRRRASERWDQLERDPDLAAPWHLLFKQVQSPRHVLSELLQNADDAGATEASVRIEKQRFIFSHNGEDFTEEHFASLCRFGFSNKRTLHTIGFRGIGFKSTFSLGDNVELHTPTLSVSFNRHRFTEPVWIDAGTNDAGATQVRVLIADEFRERQVQKNLQDWLESPVSLLFFRSIRCLRIGDQELRWDSVGPGPVPETEWMRLQADPDQAFLVAQSAPEPFPPDALSEIQQERLLGVDQNADYPPCKVEVVLGAKGRLYVVLPTGVETDLPFACNAPFIQDPGRLKIKDVEISSTNRWLLERVGALAASVMLQWLRQTQTTVEDRSRAYEFLPGAGRDDTTLEGASAAAVKERFEAEIKGKAFLLTVAGDLRPSEGAVVLPDQLLDVWPEEQASALLDYAGRPALSRYVSAGDRVKLAGRDVVEVVSRDQIVLRLLKNHLPRPDSWRRLLKLWAYVAPEISGYSRRTVDNRQVCVLPVQGNGSLYAASEVVRLGEKRLLQSDADWDLLSAHLLVLNPNWPRFLADQRREAEQGKNDGLRTDVDAAYAILKAVGLEDTSDVSAVVERVARGFFGAEKIPLSACFQFTQIACKLGATVGPAFRFATQDMNLRVVQDIVVFDKDGTLQALFPQSWCSAHLLHQGYSKSFNSCTNDDWSRWISSGRSGLSTFPPPTQRQLDVRSRQKMESDLHRRGVSGPVAFPYGGSYFEARVTDWDFEGAFWDHWRVLATSDGNLWGRIAEHIMAQPETYWSKTKGAEVYQVAKNGYMKAITTPPLLPSWILTLRELPCLMDTRGFYHKPADLFRRTAETESLMDVEPFVHSRLDTEATRPLLKLLGVQDIPTGPDRLLDRLRALAKADKPPVHEVDKWYSRLDRMADTCSSVDLVKIKKAFQEESIILTEAGDWTRAIGVFLSSDEDDAPGAAIVRASVRELALWRKLDIPERPTADLAIQWLKELPSGSPLPPEEARRVRAILTRHHVRIWRECGYWLNIVGEWVPNGTLCYAISMQTLVPWSNLHESVKQKTADFQRLGAEITQAPPFSDIPPLASRIEERLNRKPTLAGSPDLKPWLNQIGIELCRIELDDKPETSRIRALANELAATQWQTAPGLEIVPYIDGTPAGMPRRTEVVWANRVLYVDRLSNAKLARLVPDRLAKSFARPDIAATLNYCFGRSPHEVTEYLEENFKLAPREGTPTAIVKDSPRTEQPPKPASGAPTSTVVQTPANASEGKEDDEEALAVVGGPDVELERANVTEPSEEHPDSPVIPPQKTPTHPKPPKLSIIERFARSQGFWKDGHDRFLYADGSWIAKASGDRFPWERRTSRGEVVRHYWPRDHCLEREPLEIEADVWALIESHPDVYSLVLSDPHGSPVEVTGAQLLSMREGQQLTLYPATYRLVYEGE